jgi:hypothetical protein
VTGGLSRPGVAYRNAKVAVLQAAEVSYTSPEKGPDQVYEGVLAILDVVHASSARVSTSC